MDAAPGLPRQLREVLRSRLTAVEMPTLVLVILLTLVVAQSTVVMDWVRGSQILPSIALLGVLCLAVLALLRFIPSLVALPIGAALAAFVPWWFNRDALRADHPGALFGVPSPDTWIPDISGTDQTVDMALFLFLGCVLMFVVGGWLAWCSVRWRKPMLGLAPAAAIFATNVLNSTDEQNANTIYFLVLTFALLLWNGYRSSLLNARRSGLRLSSDSRWDFWETGVAATAAVTLLAIFVPPLSREDQTINVQNTVFRSWAQFQQNLNHPVEVGKGGTAIYSTGFALDAGLNGALKKSDKVVFTYSFTGQAIGARYFRGVNLQNGVRPNQWGFLNNPFGFQFFVSRNSTFPYDDSVLREQQQATFTVHMLRPPAIAPEVLFYPGALQKTDRDTVAVESYKTAANPDFGTVDRVASSHPPTSAGIYKATISYPNPTEDELRNATTDYPAWLAPYLTYPGLTATPAFASVSGGQAGAQPTTTLTIVATEPSSPTAIQIKALADQVTAGSTNVYDKAVAIESYLRTNYFYDLNPPAPKDGSTDTISSFLFDSKKGYCEYFATAMGDMLRAEGIPSRLVNGFGPGSYDSRIKQYVVKESDAHTWVEVYFPTYGWVPFEPTPDGNYFPIPRALAPSNCNRDDCSTGDDISQVPGGSVTKGKQGVRDLPGGDVPDQSGPLGSRGGFPYWTLIPLALIALGALAFFAASRYLRPKTADGVWSRVGMLSRIAGSNGPPGETPAETGRRLAAAYPEAAQPFRALAAAFAVAAYAPAEPARVRAGEVVAGWEEVRPHLIRRAIDRFKPQL